MKMWGYFLGLCSVLCLSCDKESDDKKSLPETDDMFVEKTALSNLTEVDFANLAISKATDVTVKGFAQHMLTAHSEAQIELKTIANSYSQIMWPEEMDNEHKQIKAQLMALTGQKFDSVYMTTQVVDHQKTLAIFQVEVSGGMEQRVKDYANKYLPHIQEHLNSAVSIKAEMDN